MTSLQTHLKQVPANVGYYIAISSIALTCYQNDGTDSLPSISAYTPLVSVTGTILKDMGKTLVSAGYVFRKVQLKASSAGTGPVYPDLETDGVKQSNNLTGGVANYNTFYISLPGLHGISAGGTTVENTPVARLG
jgi:hypothetical protein